MLRSFRKLDKYSSYIQPILIIISDYLAILLAELLAVEFRSDILQLLGQSAGSFHLSDFYFYLFFPAMFIACLHWGRTYIRRLSIGEMIRRTFLSVLYAIVTLIVVLYLVSSKAPVLSRLFVSVLGGFIFLTVCSSRLLVRFFLNRFKLFLEPTILIGSDQTARKVLNYSVSNAFFGINVIGIIDDYPEGKALSGQYPILGPLSKAAEIIKQTKVQNVLILSPKLESNKLGKLIDEIFPLVRNLSFVPDTENMPVSNMKLHRLYSENIIVLTLENNLSRAPNKFAKRTFDLIASILGTIAISPFLILVAILIKTTSEGPVFYGHKRVGRNGKPFYCYKFRSMVKDADKKLDAYLRANPTARREWEESQKLKNDPRVTKIGSFLRKTSLDELPQLFNVIKGEMSLVGPRPVTQEETKKYGHFLSDYEMVRPGMTGLWQTSGRSNTSYKDRVRLDAWYVRNWNLWMDISLIIKTVRVLLSKRNGAY